MLSSFLPWVKETKIPGIQTMVLGVESLFVGSCSKHSAYLCDDVVDKTISTRHSYPRHMLSVTVKQAGNYTKAAPLKSDSVAPTEGIYYSSYTYILTYSTHDNKCRA